MATRRRRRPPAARAARRAAADDRREIHVRKDLHGLAGRLRQEYGFDEAVVGESLDGGFANDLFRVVADGRDLVLRVELAPADRADTAWQHRLTRALADRLPEIVAPIETRAGATFFELRDRMHRAGAEIALPPRPRRQPLAQLQWPEAIVTPANLRSLEHLPTTAERPGCQ